MQTLRIAFFAVLSTVSHLFAEPGVGRTAAPPRLRGRGEVA